jgi:hypothetical protein
MVVLQTLRKPALGKPTFRKRRDSERQIVRDHSENRMHSLQVGGHPEVVDVSGEFARRPLLLPAQFRKVELPNEVAVVLGILSLITG